MRVLLIEDDTRLATVLQQALRRMGHVVETVHAGRDALARLASEEYSVVILDLGLPDMDGIAVARTLRTGGNPVPILMLTARDAVPDRVRGLEAGADDYLVKPFDLEELRARLQALTRRMPAIRDEVLRVADLEVDTHGMRARRGGTTLELTHKEYLVLECLARQSGRVVSRAEITAYAWDQNHDPMSNALEVTINRLRAKLDKGRSPLLQTRRGAGYVLRIADDT